LNELKEELVMAPEASAPAIQEKIQKVEQKVEQEKG